MEIYYTQKVNEAFEEMHEAAQKYRHEFTTPEHFVYALLKQYEFNMTLIDCNVDINIVNRNLKDYFEKMEHVPEEVGNYTIGTSQQLSEALTTAVRIVQNSSAHFIYVPHIVKGILDLKESYAAYLLKEGKYRFGSLLTALPASFMTAVSTTYILMSQEGFRLNQTISYVVGAFAAATLLVVYLIALIRKKK